ncbi:MAG: 3'(2'),5'-bisphosphate nucleotidase CysQ [Bacteroidota bacterium]
MNLQNLIESAIIASVDAGKEILQIYNSEELGVELKSDLSPLTLADKAAHELIVNKLRSSGFPVVSEEGEIPGYSERSNYDYYWLLDPLDGTKEFINKNGEFTVNIALLKGNILLAGVVYVPVHDLLYFSFPEGKAYKLENASLEVVTNITRSAEVLPLLQDISAYTIIASRSHLNQETLCWIAEARVKHAEIQLISAGSSMKFCRLAEGAAHVYPRFGRTAEWDTAAGHAILKASGGRVVDAKSKEEIQYNKPEMYNQGFIAFSAFQKK